MKRTFISQPEGMAFFCSLYCKKFNEVIKSINDAFACGSYTMSDEVYSELLITRWNELKQTVKQ